MGNFVNDVRIACEIIICNNTLNNSELQEGGDAVNRGRTSVRNRG